MINPLLHAQPVPVDSVQHREVKLKLPVTDWSVASRLNALFVAAAEFGDTCREYPLVFVRAGKGDDGQELFAPIAVFGLVQHDNLFVEQGAWRAAYIPAVLRSYPFCVGRLDAERLAICVDMAWPGVSMTEGQRLFTPAGEPTENMMRSQEHLETLEGEVQRTQRACQRLAKLDLLREMRLDATLADGRQHSVDGFMMVDEDKLRALPDAVLAELVRDGMLSLVHAHWVSLGNMRRLLEWHVVRHGGAAANAAPADQTAANSRAST